MKEGASILDKRSPTLTLEPNASYWNKARIPKATFVFDNVISKAEALEEVAKGGKVDIVTELSPAEAMALKKSSKAKVVESKSKTVLVGVLNRNVANSKWNASVPRIEKLDPITGLSNTTLNHEAAVVYQLATRGREMDFFAQLLEQGQPRMLLQPANLR